MNTNTEESRNQQALADEQKKATEAKAAEEKRLADEAKAAEQKKQNETKLANQKLQHDAKAAALKAKREKAGDVHFLRGDKVYTPLIPAVLIPGLGKRTALEICADTKAQDYLINEGCIGSVIEEVL